MRASERSAPPPREEDLIEDAVRQAGIIALRDFRSGQKGWTKHDGTPVSETDLAVDRLLEQRLRSAYPAYGWLSEESADTGERLVRDRVWVVDPIDGTSAFLEGGEGWCIAVALVERGRPIVAGILKPVTGEYFSAVLGAGARLDGSLIRASLRDRLEGASLLIKPRVLALDIWPRPWPSVRSAMTPSIALRLCRVASGHEDGAFALGRKSDWDLAAGDLIVHEAGGRMTDLTGSTMLYNRREVRQDGFVAAGSVLFEDLLSHAAPGAGRG